MVPISPHPDGPSTLPFNRLFPPDDEDGSSTIFWESIKMILYLFKLTELSDEVTGFIVK